MTDTSPSFARLPILPMGTNDWTTFFAVQTGPGFAGDEFDVRGKLQAKNNWTSVVEYRVALFAYIDHVPPLAQAGLTGLIGGSITGENVGPASSAINDKYVVLDDSVLWAAPTDYTLIYFALRASARSTAATATARLDFGNGRIQVRKYEGPLIGQHGRPLSAP